MTQYLLSMYQPQGPIPAPEVLEPVMKEMAALREELRAAGAWVFAGGLHQPDTATVVRRQDGGGMLVTDGPFAEGKEYLGGVTVISVPDLDAALAWAGRYAEATGLPIEVRPFQDRAPAR